jgi:PAS domain-containing protein
MSPQSSAGCHQEGHGSLPPERRLRRAPATAHDYLSQLPALVLLNRLPTPALALELDGEIVFANPALAEMLGYPDPGALVECRLSDLMAGPEDTSPRSCVATLQAAAGAITDWRHADGYGLHAVVSKTLLRRNTDSVLLITLTDVTDLLWCTSA